MATQDSDTQLVCHACIGEVYLAKEVEAQNSATQCSYCGVTRSSLTLGEFADRIRSALENHYELTPDGPTEWYEFLDASEGDWDRRGEPTQWVIAEVAGLDERIAKDVTELLSERYGRWVPREEGREDPYGYDARYEPRQPNDREFRYNWAKFRHEIQSRSRFFSTETEGMLDFIFGDLNDHVSAGERPVVREFNPGDEDASIWRGRAAQSTEEVKSILGLPSREIGPPPSRLAKAGRMNPQGISVFYGALDKYTCIAEVRAPVGSSVVVGKFDLLRTIRLLDLDALADVYARGSIFDPSYRELEGRAAFFTRLVSEISGPVMPQDEEVEYLSTQAVAEYLAQKTNPRIDGIIFRSSQTGGEGRNLVLFPHACRVEPYVLPAGSSLEVLLPVDILEGSDDSFDDVLVLETLPSNSTEGDYKITDGERQGRPIGLFDEVESEDFENSGDATLRLDSEDFENSGDATLRLDMESVEVLGMQAVTYTFNSRSVTRYKQTEAERDSFERQFDGKADFDDLLSEQK